jgi:hypothetical protein
MRLLTCYLACLVALVGSTRAASPDVATFRIEHKLTVTKIPAGSHEVRIWFWLPDDDDSQKVLDLRVKDAPPGYRLTRDANYGHRYLYAAIANPTSDHAAISTEFLLRRSAVSLPVDSSRAAAHRPASQPVRRVFAARRTEHGSDRQSRRIGEPDLRKGDG